MPWGYTKNVSLHALKLFDPWKPETPGLEKKFKPSTLSDLLKTLHLVINLESPSALEIPNVREPLGT